MKKVFISYRRADSKHITGRIYDRLIKVYKRKNIFKDVDSIPHGKDYRIVIENAVKSSDIILAIIGTNWASITDENNNIRIHNKNDFVRLEIELGLENKIPIIPVLVDNATLPNKKEFPASILPLYYKNAIKVRHDPDFNNDIKKLIDSMIQIVEPERGFKKFISSLTHISKTMRYVLLGVVLGIFIVLYTFNLKKNTLNKDVTIAVDYNSTKANKNNSVIKILDGLEWHYRYVNDKLAGRILAFYENTDTLARVTYYKDGKLDGNFTVYAKSGKLRDISYYKSGVQINKTEYYPSKRKRRVYTYDNDGNLDDITRDYFDTDKGELKTEFHSKNKELICIKDFYINGKLKKEQHLKNDKLDGNLSMYGEDGNITDKITYKDGEEVMTQAYHPNGNIKEKTTYKDAKTGMNQFYYLSGELKSVQYFKNDKLDGNSIIYGKSGKITDKLTFKNGEEVMAQTYYLNGNIKQKINYKNGKIDGNFTMYNEEGKIAQNAVYKDGKIEVVHTYDSHGKLILGGMHDF